MNILGTCRHLLSYLNLSSSPAMNEAQPVADNDNGEAAGGYDDSVDIGDAAPGRNAEYDTVTPSHGPASKGKSKSESDGDVQDPGDSDGPGAGGGYNPGDSDGPGAGGGYDLLHDGDGPGAGGGYFNSTNFLGQQWLMGPSGSKAANSNKKPSEGKAE